MASNFYEAFAQGQANGLERQKAVTQRNQLAELQSLAPQVMSGDLDATSRAFSLDPTRAQSYQTEGNRQQQQLVGLAKTLKQFANNPQMQAGVYRSALPYLKRNFGAEIPDDFDAASVMPIVDQVLAVAENTPSMGAGSGVQSTYVDDQGRRVAILRNGATQVLGGNDTGSNQQTLTIDVNGTPTQVTFDRRTGRYTNASLSGPGAGQVQQVNGQQTYIDPSLPPQVQAALRAGAGDNLQDGGQLQIPQAAGQPLVGRRAEEQAAAIEAAKAGVENANFPNRLDQERQLQDVKTQGAITQAAGTAAAEAEAKDTSQRPKRIQQYRQALTAAGNVETSLDKALGLLSPYSTGFVGARSRSIEGSPSYNLASELETIKANLGFDRLQQMRDSSPTGGALGAIAVQELVALQSTIANLDPNQSEEQIRANLDRVKTHYKNWRSAVQQSLADEERAQKAQPASAPSGRSIARRGRAPDGRTVIQYNDGTIEYGN